VVAISDPAQIFSGAPKCMQVLVETGVLSLHGTQHVGCFKAMSLAASDGCVGENSRGTHVINSQTDTIQGPNLFCYSSPSKIDSPASSLRLLKVCLKILQQKFALHLSHSRISCLPIPAKRTVTVSVI